MGWRACAAAAVAMVISVSGCGGPTGRPASEPATPAPPTSVGAVAAPSDPAMAGWERFPVDARPRPVVLGQLVLPPEGGFADGPAKEAFGAGSYQLAAALPSAVAATVTVELSDGRFELPTRSARQALAALAAGSDTEGVNGAALQITAVTWGSALFPTDRGPQELPAWLITVPGALGPITVAGLADTALWPVPSEQAFGIGSVARTSPDGRRVTVALPAPGPSCPGRAAPTYTPFATETRTTVTVGVHVTDPPDSTAGPGPDCLDDGVLRLADYTVELAAPLGNRVLLTPLGSSADAVMAVVPG